MMTKMTENEALVLDQIKQMHYTDLEGMWESNAADMLMHKSALGKQLIDCIEGNVIDNVLDLLLKLMGLMFQLDHDYRRNIENFQATYVFTDFSGNFYTAVEFNNGKMKVTNQKVTNPTFKLIFRDTNALISVLFQGATDILNAMLNQEVDFEGNINYMSKFGYMALHPVLELTGKTAYAK